MNLLKMDCCEQRVEQLVGVADNKWAQHGGISTSNASTRERPPSLLFKSVTEECRCKQRDLHEVFFAPRERTTSAKHQSTRYGWIVGVAIWGIVAASSHLQRLRARLRARHSGMERRQDDCMAKASWLIMMMDLVTWFDHFQELLWNLVWISISMMDFSNG